MFGSYKPETLSKHFMLTLSQNDFNNFNIVMMQQTIKDLFEEPSGLESLAKEVTKEEKARDASVGNGNSSTSVTAQADTSATDSVLNDDLMEQVIHYSAMNYLLKCKNIIIANDTALIYVEVSKSVKYFYVVH